jgi:hypothetical protein
MTHNKVQTITALLGSTRMGSINQALAKALCREARCDYRYLNGGSRHRRRSATPAEYLIGIAGVSAAIYGLGPAFDHS